MWIEIFKSGTHTGANGKTSNFTAENINEIAAKYNSAIEKDSSLIAPLVKGHPRTNDPAYGWVERLSRKGDLLLAKIKDLHEDLVSDIKNGMFKKISVSLYPDLMLRHVGLLGAFPPAVKGLKPLEFAETKDFNEFSLQSSPYNDFTELINRNDVLNNEKNKLNNELREERKKLKHIEHLNFVESISANGNFLNYDQKEAIADALDFASEADIELKSGQNENLESVIKNLLKNLFPAVELKEYSSSIALTNNDFGGRNINIERLDIHRNARHLMACDPTLAYEEAVIIVQNQK